LVFAALAGLCACSTTPRPITNTDPSADFAGYRTFGFIENPSTNTRDYESLVTTFLKAAVAREMDRRGLEYAESPDLVVNFYVNTEDRITTRRVPTTNAYYGWRDPFYDTWGGYLGYQTEIDQFTEGTLHIDVVEAASRRLIWEGRLAGRVTEAAIANMEASIDKGVRIIMSEFPVRPVGP
jgi:hypothetical protein